MRSIILLLNLVGRHDSVELHRRDTQLTDGDEDVDPSQTSHQL